MASIISVKLPTPEASASVRSKAVDLLLLIHCLLLLPLFMEVYTTLTNFSIKYLMMCKVYTDVAGIK